MEVVYRCPDEAGVTVPRGVLLPEFVLEHAHRWPQGRALVDGVTGRVLTYAEVEQLVYNVAAGLKSHGMRHGEVVMLLLPNLPEYPILFLGVIAGGGVVTTANPSYTASELAHQIVDSATRLVITSNELLGKVQNVKVPNGLTFIVAPTAAADTTSSSSSSSSSSAPPPVFIIPISRLFQADGSKIRQARRQQAAEAAAAAAAAAEAAAEAAQTDGSPGEDRHHHHHHHHHHHYQQQQQQQHYDQQHTTCALPYSSGTTGTSKGVMLSHANLVANLQQMLGGRNPRLDISSDDVTLGLLPMFHIYAITLVNLLSLRAGACVVTLPRFDLLLFLATLQRFKVSIAPLVPPIILAMAKLPIVASFDLSSLRRVVSGAAPLGAELEEAFRNKFPTVQLGQGYGMTEASPVITASRLFSRQTSPATPGSCGSLLPLTEMKVVGGGSEGGGVETSLLPGERGELLVRGPQVMKGFLNNPSATAATITSDGWLRTGDVALVDANGEVFVVDRVKELIKVKGFQVPPAELEGILVSHPDIVDAAVVPLPDEESGEVPIAFVVTRPGGKPLSKEEIKSFVAKQVATYKRLHDVRFVDAIPKTASGKVLRKDLRSKL